MLETTANFLPLILVALILLMYTWESFMPYLTPPENKRKHDRRNLALSLISFSVNGLIAGGVAWSLMLTQQRHWGLFNQIELPDVAEMILCILLLDFGSYALHNLQHRLPFLWRLHKVHHSDPHLNASSVLRFHPIEVLLTQGIYQAAAIMVWGISPAAFALYGLMALPLLVFQHANVRFPDWFERYGRLVFSTPGWHKIHHSDEQQFTDSHYGDVFTFWDRIFGTHHAVQPEDIHYGLKAHDNDQDQSVVGQLMLPFKP